MTDITRTGDSLPPVLQALASPGRVTVFYFMRTADCPICRGHVARLAALEPRLSERGARVVVLAPGLPGDAPPSWAAAQPFPVLLSDAAHASAGFSRVLGIGQQSGTIVATADGVVAGVRRATVPFQAFDERELWRQLDELRGTGGARAAE